MEIGLSVSCSTSHDVATADVIEPDEENTWQMNHQRYRGSRSDWNARTMRFPDVCSVSNKLLVFTLTNAP
ncbi:hypothetical protein GCM10022255_055490 [Dactylosporangium darangshiense]|uniref:Uncharacterized protein n=1 Tax=Dactylosporangium darangshiense TaxID=579108 RepID=A0ABP8DDZ9_9ACTN